MAWFYFGLDRWFVFIRESSTASLFLELPSEHCHVRHIITNHFALFLTVVLPLTILAENPRVKTPHEGLWLPLSATLGGKPMPAEVLKIMTLRLEGNHYMVKIGNQIDKGTWKLLPKTKPQAMDITGTVGPNKGKTIPSIVEVKGDKMKICYGLTGQRPKEFKTAGQSGLYLVIYKRQKDRLEVEMKNFFEAFSKALENQDATEGVMHIAPKYRGGFRKAYRFWRGYKLSAVNVIGLPDKEGVLRVQTKVISPTGKKDAEIKKLLWFNGKWLLLER